METKRGCRHTQPKPDGSLAVNDHPLHSSLSLGFSMKSKSTNQCWCIFENSSSNVGSSSPFCFSILTLYYRNLLYSLVLPRAALVRRVLDNLPHSTRCDNGSAFLFCCCAVFPFLDLGPILLSTRQRQEIPGNKPTTLCRQLWSRSSTLENRRTTRWYVFIPWVSPPHSGAPRVHFSSFLFSFRLSAAPSPECSG